ncbi:MAG: phosphatidylglycerophosphatase A [Verrucomicrobiota bacterium]
MNLRPGHPLWPRFLPTPVVVNLATVGPVGRIRKAPGTWGSVAGLLYFTVLFARVEPWALILWSALGLWLAVGICGEAEFRLNLRDPGMVVLDEFMAMPLCFVAWQWLPGDWVGRPWAVFLAGFALFRLFDVAKPLGISRLQHLPGGWGVVVDDVAAALAACATMHLAGWAWTASGI